MNERARAHTHTHTHGRRDRHRCPPYSCMCTYAPLPNREWVTNTTKLLSDAKATIQDLSDRITPTKYVWSTTPTPKEGKGYHNRKYITPLNALAREIAQNEDLELVDMEMILMALVRTYANPTAASQSPSPHPHLCALKSPATEPGRRSVVHGRQAPISPNRARNLQHIPQCPLHCRHLTDTTSATETHLHLDRLKTPHRHYHLHLNSFFFPSLPLSFSSCYLF